MKLGIMQPYFFPYLGYWQLINAVDKYVIYDDVNYKKGSWINRNRILINGEGKLINVEVHNASPNKLINEVEVSGNASYKQKKLKMLAAAYGKAPHYTDVFPVIEDVITQEEKNLAQYLAFSIRRICDYLAVDTEILVSSTLDKNNELRAQEKVIEICKLLGVDEYVNAIGGSDLYRQEHFTAQGIQLVFLKTGEILYPQFKNEFVPNLSIIDVMMFNSKDETMKLLEKYEKIYYQGG